MEFCPIFSLVKSAGPGNPVTRLTTPTAEQDCCRGFRTLVRDQNAIDNKSRGRAGGQRPGSWPQFVKRAGWHHFRQCAADDDEAYIIWDAVVNRERALQSANYKPRLQGNEPSCNTYIIEPNIQIIKYLYTEFFLSDIVCAVCTTKSSGCNVLQPIPHLIHLEILPTFSKRYRTPR